MPSILVKSAEFATSAADPKGYPAPDRPEVAFVGRSNVGKSSLINALTQRKKLVRVSNTPGRTRLLNFFDVSLVDGDGEVHTLRFCDLPGYGYAKVSKSEREGWQAMIETYLRGREGLQAVVLIMDGEVGPTELDGEMLSWLRAAGRLVVPVVTKMDRINKARRRPAVQKAAIAMGLPESRVVVASATARLGLDEIWAAVLGEGLDAKARPV